MNFNKLKDSIENVEKKLSILLDNMEYQDYLEFIKSSNELKNFDDIIGLYSNNLVYNESMVNSMPEDFISKIDRIVSDKIIEEGLENKLEEIEWQ